MQAYCRLHGIAYQGYSTLGGQWLGQYGGRNPVLLHPTIGEIAARKKKTPAQVGGGGGRGGRGVMGELGVEWSGRGWAGWGWAGRGWAGEQRRSVVAAGGL